MPLQSAPHIAICWTRVDDRLIHGQVIVAWRRYLGYDEICVVDDGVRANPFLREVMRMAAPSGIQVNVRAVQEAIPTLKAAASRTGGITPPLHRQSYKRPDLSPDAPPAHDAERHEPHSDGDRRNEPKVLLLVKNPQTALALSQGGVLIPHLNVGNIAAAPGRVRVFKSISLNPEHAAALDALAAQGTRITFQLTPDDTQADWQAIRRNLAIASA